MTKQIEKNFFRKETWDFDRYELLEGKIPDTLLQVVSAEYYKLPIKDEEGEFEISAEKASGQKEGVAFAEIVVAGLRRRLLNDELQDYPTTLATVMKDPEIKGIIDPDAIGVKKGVDNPALDQSIKSYQRKILELVQERMSGDKPFLHILISERRMPNSKEIVIAGGMRKQNFPADPRILRWFQEKLQNKLTKNNVQGATVKIATEGERICGSPVHVERRKFLGDLYQFIKLKVPTGLLQESSYNIVSVIAEVMKDFKEEFPTQESLEKYLQDNIIEEDRYRLEGRLYKEVGVYPESEIEKNEIALSKNLRLALGVNPGDKVVVTRNDGVQSVFKVISAKKVGGSIPRIPMFHPTFFVTGRDKVVIERSLQKEVS